jgi:hypothetical protein
MKIKLITEEETEKSNTSPEAQRNFVPGYCLFLRHTDLPQSVPTHSHFPLFYEEGYVSF